MKSNTFSVVTGTAACNADCPYCVSKMTRAVATKIPTFNERRFRTACGIAQQAGDGVTRVIITGQGEPLLYPKMITDYLGILWDFSFPLIDLQTNGILIPKLQQELKTWLAAGLNLVSVSIAHWQINKSNQLMGIKEGRNQYDIVRLLHDLGFSVRLSCTMLEDGISTFDQVKHLIDNCQRMGVEQLTLREVDHPTVTKDTGAAREVQAYVRLNKPEGSATCLHHMLSANGATKLLTLPHGGIVYDLKGQNVCVSNCLTRSTDGENTRQIIFFPTGRIAYDWSYLGATIL